MVKIVNLRFARKTLRRHLRALFATNNAGIRVPASYWSDEFVINYTLKFAHPASFTVRVELIMNGETTFLRDIHCISQVVKSMWDNAKEREGIREANRRHWRVIEKLAE